MQSIHVDTEHNRLYIKIAGSISIAEAQTISILIRRKVAELKPGFIVIDDLTEFQLTDLRAGVCLQGVLQFFLDHHVSAVIRVVGSSKIALLLFSKFSKIFQSKITIFYIPSHAELPATIEKVERIKCL